MLCRALIYRLSVWQKLWKAVDNIILKIVTEQLNLAEIPPRRITAIKIMLIRFVRLNVM